MLLNLANSDSLFAITHQHAVEQVPQLGWIISIDGNAA
jgi:hypothetical protein